MHGTMTIAGNQRIQVVYTRDRLVDYSDGSWASVPEPPGEGWAIWDFFHERKTGWLRIQRDGGDA